MVKTTSEEVGTYSVPVPPTSSSKTSILEPTHVPRGFKIFLNICWDSGVPAPPQRSEQDIRKAMMGEDLLLEKGDSPGPYFVPVVVSDGRPITDKCKYDLLVPSAHVLQLLS